MAQSHANPGEEFREMIRDLYGAAGIIDGRAKAPEQRDRKKGTG